MSEYLIHRSAAGERWDQLAWRYYGDATRYEPIIAANPAVAPTAVLPAGVNLRIPRLAAPTTSPSAEAPPWLR